MRRAACVLFAAGLTACATAPRVSTTLADCSLSTEAACVAYGATVPDVPPRPSAQLLVGLADRSAQLPGREKIDYWRRIVEVHRSIDLDEPLLHRRAAPAYAGVAITTITTAPSVSSGEDALQDAQHLVAQIAHLAKFAITWGELDTQVCGTHAIAVALRWHADNVERFEVPAELSVSGRAVFDERRGAIAASLREEAATLATTIEQQSAHEPCSHFGLEL